MRPPYDISPKILQLVSSISIKLGEVNANYLNKATPQLRKQSKIKTILSSLQIEGNTLNEEQVSAIFENKRVIGPRKDILEVQNAIKVYDSFNQFKSASEKSLLLAHKMLMNGLIDNAGSFRNTGVGIVKGSIVTPLAPPSELVPALMNDLMDYLKNDKELALIKSCVFHYELEFIHPFTDGNGRMGRLWQTLILLEEFPVFEFLPFETLIKSTQINYYKALSMSDKMGKSTLFIEYLLDIIDKSLEEMLHYTNKVMTSLERLNYFIQEGIKEFTRKDYMLLFKDISTATASRDLQKGIELKLLKKSGLKNKTRYSVLN